MDRRIRQVATLLTMLIIAVTASAGWIQGIRAEQVAANEPANPNDPTQVARNRFRIFQECRWERGAILSVDGQVLAESVPTTSGRRCLFERRYPAGDLVSHVVGQWSLHFGKSGLEAAYNQDLVGEPLPAETFADVFTQRPRQGNTVVSTIDTRLQRTALDALEGRRGGVVALNPKTGAVFVAASNPSYDPEPLASNDRTEAIRARCRLGIVVPGVTDEQGRPLECKNPASPLISVALQSRRPPGSSFKVVTAAAALESGKYTPTSPSAPSTSAYTAPGDTRAIHNYGGGSCGGNLTQALRVSCNTAFARFGVDVGEEQLLTTAHAMGLDANAGAEFVGCGGEPLTKDLRETRTGCLPSELVRSDAEGNEIGREKLATGGFRARAAFGQWVLQVSPFGMAVVSATIANGGFTPRPRFGDRIVDRRGVALREERTSLGPAALSENSATELTQMMRNVVTSGTGASAFRGFSIPTAGKTGTAQQPTCASDERAIFGENCGRLPHAWFIAFAPVGDPTIAVAVLVERGGGTNETATGGRVAAPVARAVLEDYFRLYPAAAGG